MHFFTKTSNAVAYPSTFFTHLHLHLPPPSRLCLPFLFYLLSLSIIFPFADGELTPEEALKISSFLCYNTHADFHHLQLSPFRSSSNSIFTKTPLLPHLRRQGRFPVSPHTSSLYVSSRRHLMVMRRKKKYRTTGPSTAARHYGLKGSGKGPRIGKNTGVPLKPISCPARRCMLLGKMDNTKACNRSHSRIATHRVQRLNLHWKRLWWEEGGYYVRLRLSTKGIRTIKKYGLQRAADKFGLVLKNKKYYAGYSHRRMVTRLSEETLRSIHNGKLCSETNSKAQAEESPPEPSTEEDDSKDGQKH